MTACAPSLRGGAPSAGRSCAPQGGPLEVVETTGFDDMLQLIGSGPTGVPENTGIRLPALPGIWYRILLAVADLAYGDELVGYRQGLSLGSEITSGEGQNQTTYVEERWIESNLWRFIDGADVWTLTRDTIPPAPPSPQGPNDQTSFMHRTTDQPAMLYETATIPAPTGGTVYPGYLGLSHYTPGAMEGSVELRVHGIREPMQRSRWHPIGRTAETPTRYRFYLDVLQTNPGTRVVPTLGFDASTYAVRGLEEEESYQQLFLSKARYWRAYGALAIKRYCR